jgi:hypothetical protein
MIIKKYDPDRVPKEYVPKLDDEAKANIINKIKAFVTEDKTYEEVRRHLSEDKSIPTLTGHEANSFIRQVDKQWREEEWAVKNPVEEPVKDPVEDPIEVPK